MEDGVQRNAAIQILQTALLHVPKIGIEPQQSAKKKER
jgi:hypothetical protein